jgi:hypothetical protein
MLDAIKKLTIGGTVAIATAGFNVALSACDPGPLPVSCDAPSNDPSSAYATIQATALLSGATMTITFDTCGGAASCCLPTGATVAGVTGAELVSVDTSGLASSTIVATFTLSPPADGGASVEGAAGSFLLVVPVGDDVDTTAFTVTRAFTFQVVDGQVVLDQKIAAAPLQRRGGAAIVVVEREGADLVLEPRSSFRGEVQWSVSGGRAVGRAGGRVAWRLPEEPGWYQAELVVDDGERGFARDVLTVEVT